MNVGQTKPERSSSREEHPASMDSNIVDDIGSIMASVTQDGEQVETYTIQNVGDASIVTKCYDDGTSMAYIVSRLDDGYGCMMVALNGDD